MRKTKKVLFTSLFSIAMMLLLTFSASATTIKLNHAVPTMQGYVNLSIAIKSESSTYGTVNLTKKDPDAVTFSARYLNSLDKWEDYYLPAVVSSTNVTTLVFYPVNLGVGTTVQARFRNHNWSLNSNQIEGIYDYK